MVCVLKWEREGERKGRDERKWEWREFGQVTHGGDVCFFALIESSTLITTF